MRRSVVVFVLLVLWTGRGVAQVAEVKSQYEILSELLGEDSFFDNHLTGFMLFDLDNQWVMFEKNSHMNFIPASSTKLLTFYASLLILGDSTRTFRYATDGDQITIWGTGDPSWKNDLLPQPDLEDFFMPYSHIRYSNENWKDHAFGYGWQWDDYYFSYSAERSSFPVYGNVVTFTNRNKIPEANIGLLRAGVKTVEKEMKGVERERLDNLFVYNPSTYTSQKSQIPFITSPELTSQLLEETLGKKVSWVTDSLSVDARVHKGGTLSPLWKEMLQESDNFIAEQILLMISDALFGELDAGRAIEYIQKTYMWDFPDKTQWVDGSGLSRHNLATPRTMVHLMTKLDRQMPRSRLMQLLPQGGINGTLKNNYKASKPYVFAKTGTISNNHTLVGYIKGDSGRHYAFAFMNNNYLNKASEIRREMEKVLLAIKENF